MACQFCFLFFKGNPGWARDLYMVPNSLLAWKWNIFKTSLKQKKTKKNVLLAPQNLSVYLLNISVNDMANRWHRKTIYRDIATGRSVHGRSCCREASGVQFDSLCKSRFPQSNLHTHAWVCRGLSVRPAGELWHKAAPGDKHFRDCHPWENSRNQSMWYVYTKDLPHPLLQIMGQSHRVQREDTWHFWWILKHAHLHCLIFFLWIDPSNTVVFLSTPTAMPEIGNAFWCFVVEMLGFHVHSQ